MLEREKVRRDAVEIINTDELVPQDYLLRKTDAAVGFDHLYDFVETLYCEDKSIVFWYIMTYYNRRRIYTANPCGLPPAMYRQAARGLAA